MLLEAGKEMIVVVKGLIKVEFRIFSSIGEYYLLRDIFCILKPTPSFNPDIEKVRLLVPSIAISSHVKDNA